MDGYLMEYGVTQIYWLYVYIAQCSHHHEGKSIKQARVTNHILAQAKGTLVVCITNGR